MPSYYDIDTILAEEELVPCTNLFDFSHLAHLDPDLVDTDKHYLPESSQVKVPLWAMEKWAMLGFVRISLPRHYSKKARERLAADPSEADLRYVLLGDIVMLVVTSAAITSP
jgi:GINS complex subunit 3